MYNNYKVGFGAIIALAMMLVTGCSDDFLADKEPYGQFGPDLVYGDWNSVKLRLNYLYEKSLPYYKGYNNATNNFYPDLWPVGLPDDLSASTDEFVKYGIYTDPTTVWDNTNISKYFFYGTNESPWKKIRECNDVIYRANESTTLTDEQKHWAEGQARFFRATRYFRMWKRYGGLPIVSTLQSTIQGDSISQRVTRNSTEETYKFMIEDCIYAGENLPTRWEEEANDWGRIVAGAGYALAGIIANYYASPVFNRADEADRWEEAYDLNKKALEKLAEGNFGLAYEGNPGNNASNWAKIWTTMTGGDGTVSEAVYVAICNNTADSDGNDLFNCWEQQIRPSNAEGGSKRDDDLTVKEVTPSAELVDDFPMADGKRPTEAGEYTYDKTAFFLNRDPRFYRTFAFPGVEWKFEGNLSTDKASSRPYLNGNSYQLWNLAWYASSSEAINTATRGYYTDYLGTGGKTVYIRKKSQDYALGNPSLYIFQNDGGFKRNGQPLIAIRYTEVLLNFAEAACGANHLDEAWDALIRIRQRVGYEGNCGLDSSIRTDRAKMFEAILYERRIELAFEGKRFDDCHRWMLFDGGAGQENIESSWKLTGWGGNTCQYLGVTPLNEVPRHTIELYINPEVYIANRSADTDPFITKDLTKPTALTLNEDMTATTVTDNSTGSTDVTYANNNVQKMATFYKDNLVRKDVVTMTTGNPYWDPKLYFMGLASGDQSNNPAVVQTIGWQSRFGGMGIFDPLSKNPRTSITEESNEPVVSTTTE
jgi:hypothetical protein